MVPRQVGEKYVFTVADSSRIDSFDIVVEGDGHNALSDIEGPAKVRQSLCSGFRPSAGAVERWFDVYTNVFNFSYSARLQHSWLAWYLVPAAPGHFSGIVLECLLSAAGERDI